MSKHFKANLPSETIPAVQKKIKKKLNRRRRLIKRKMKLSKGIKIKSNCESETTVINKLNPPTTEESKNGNLDLVLKAQNVHSKKRKSKESPLKNEIKEKKFKPIYEIKKPEDYSANWKQLKDIITRNDKERKSKSLPKNSKDAAAAAVIKPSQTDHLKKEEVWFDDVDPILLEDRQQCSLQGNSEDKVSGIKILNKSGGVEGSSMNLMKKDSFTGVTRALALDCEMVGGGLRGDDDILARVSIVNHYGNGIYDKYVKPGEPIKDYRTQVSGIRPSDLVNGESFSTVQKEVSDLIKGRIVVGHALSNDFRCLLLSHPKHMIRDTSRFKPFIKLVSGGIPSLKKLTDKVLGIQIQTGEHNSVQDAQAAMRLYTLNRKEWETNMQKKKRMRNRKLKRILVKEQHSEDEAQ